MYEKRKIFINIYKNKILILILLILINIYLRF